MTYLATIAAAAVRVPRARAVVALTLTVAVCSLAVAQTYTIDTYVLSAGLPISSNNCFRLAGTVGEPAPGYSGSPTYSVYAGFHAAAPAKPVDEIFFTGFEAC
jgi:hypothetical protein